MRNSYIGLLVFALSISAGCTTGNIQRQVNPDQVEWVHVHSRSIDVVGYDTAREVMTVQFWDGCTHEYSNVSAYLYQGFLQSAGKGGFFRAHIETLPRRIVYTQEAVCRETRTVAVKNSRYDEAEVLGYSDPYTVVERK